MIVTVHITTPVANTGRKFPPKRGISAYEASKANNIHINLI